MIQKILHFKLMKKKVVKSKTYDRVKALKTHDLNDTFIYIHTLGMHIEYVYASKIRCR